MRSIQLVRAKKNKNDEFYTLYSDVVAELSHYNFKDKIIYCNCDDGHVSNFFKYFVLNFKKLGIKKVICSGFTLTAKMNGVFYYDGGNYIIVKKGEADFRENIELLKECDIVVTNPPFSLFRDYIDLLMEYNKKFLVLGNINAITYNKIFPLIKNNKIWLGYKSLNNDMYFNITDEYKQWLLKNKKEGSAYVIINGVVMGRLASACWFTNLDHGKLHEILELDTMAHNLKFNKNLKKKFENYGITSYPHYDNYDAIEVPFTECIPSDYDGVMGVPITFLDKYNPSQFEILDINPHFFMMQKLGLPKPRQLTLHAIGAKDPYARILIKKVE